jgi:iron complex outermembrane receptor protein
MLGNPQLAPEVNNQMDIIFEWANDATAINVDLFASYLQNFISSAIDPALSPRMPSSPGVRKFCNVDKAFKTGFEVSWIQQLPLGLQQSLAAAFTYAQNLELNEPLPEIAPMDIRYVLAGSYLKDKLRPEVTFRYVIEQDRVSQEFGETVTPSFALLDVKIIYRFTDQLGANVGVNNLFNQNYYEHLSRSIIATDNPIFAPGRNVFVKLSFLF